jgi:hypothetical protein
MYFFLKVYFHISLKQLKWKTILSKHFSAIVFHVLRIYMAITQYINVIYTWTSKLTWCAYTLIKALKHAEHDIDTTLILHGHSQEYQMLK